MVCVGFRTEFFVLRDGNQVLENYGDGQTLISNQQCQDIETMLSNIRRDIRASRRQ